MGSICSNVETDKRESEIEKARQVPRLRQPNGIYTRRYSNANKSKVTAMNRRNEQTKQGCSTRADSNSTALTPRINDDMSAVSSGRRVKFDHTVTVYTPIDWLPDVYRDARKGPWMYLAADRCRFKRRIKQTELLLGDIFCDAHRENVRLRLFDE